MAKRSKSRDPEQIEQDFSDSLERLKAGKPRLPEFKERIAGGKIVPVNTLNVAKEAGRSRGLIATDNPRYQKVRELIRLESGGDTDQPQTLDGAVRKLRRDIADLRAELKTAKEQQAAAVIAKEQAERKAEKERKEKERLRKRIGQTEATAQRSTRSEKVTPLYDSDKEDLS